eukprot:SAG22_NODE_8546_length_646_cov_4.614260_1_plen_182_part_10
MFHPYWHWHAHARAMGPCALAALAAAAACVPPAVTRRARAGRAPERDGNTMSAAIDSALAALAPSPWPGWQPHVLLSATALAACTVAALLFFKFFAETASDRQSPERSTGTGSAAMAAAAEREHPPPGAYDTESELLAVGDDVCGRPGCLRCYGLPQSADFAEASRGPRVPPRLGPMLAAAR